MKKYLYLASMVALIAGTDPVLAQEAEGAASEVSVLTDEGLQSFSTDGGDPCTALAELKGEYVDITGSAAAKILAANAELEAAGQGNSEVMQTVVAIKDKYAGAAGEDKGYTGDKGSDSYREYKMADLNTKYPGGENCQADLTALAGKYAEHRDKVLADVEKYNLAVDKVNAAPAAGGTPEGAPTEAPAADQQVEQQ